ncbi:MAG: TerC family protein [Actinomycetota bacterium]
MLETLAAWASAAPEPAKQFASFDVPLWVWAALLAGVAALLVADLLIVHRTAHVITFREAAIESAVWVTLGLSFVGVILWWQGSQAAGEYLAGYLIEKSLSVDNVFIWVVIFSYFSVPREYQFRVLFWGIFGALVMRGIFIFTGVALIEAFDWILYVFGAFLLFTAFKIARHDEAEVHPERNPILRLVHRFIASTTEYDGQRMFTKKDGRRLATPLFAVLIVVESTDVIFAVDSVPAILAVSREPFIVFSSNAFAILGLRALYFLLAGMAGRFRYLNIGLGVILAFVGVKMLLANVYHFPTWISLLVIAAILTVTIWASIAATNREETRRVDAPEVPAPADEGSDPHPR